MYKFKGKTTVCCRPIIVKNQAQDRAIDSKDGDYVMNKYGHIRSDFAVLTQSTNDIELAKALATMQQMYQDNSSQFDGMTFEQMVKTVRPRWCQLPGEVDRFEQYLIDEALDFYKKLRQDEIDSLEDEGVKNPASAPEDPATLAPASSVQGE